MHSQHAVSEDMQECILPVNAGMHHDRIFVGAYPDLMTDHWQIRYIRHLMALTGMTPTRLAKEAGVSQTTLTRPLNSPEHQHEVSIPTLEKLQRMTGISYAPFSTPALKPNAAVASPPPPSIGGFQDEATPFVMAKSTFADPVHALFGHFAKHPCITHMVQASLPAFGLFKGDMLVCDLSRLPIPGDLAIATVAMTASGETHTIIRRFLPPYLLSATPDGQSPMNPEPPETVTLRHPIIGSIRSAA